MQVTLSTELLHAARRRAAGRGISVAEHIRRLIEADAGPQETSPRIDHLFDLGDSGGSDVEHHKDSYLDVAMSDR